MTATTGRTVLALVAILSLLLSAFAIARPVIATEGGEYLNPDHVGTSWDDEGQNAKCPAEDLAKITDGQVLWHFVLTSPSASSAQLWIEFEDDGVVGPFPNADHPSSTLHWWIIRDGPDTLVDAWTDISGGNLNLSHICNKVEGSIIVHKTDQTQADVAGAEFTVKYDGSVVAGPAWTDADGLVCFDGLEIGTSYKVVETDAPDGWLPADPDYQMVAAVEGSCDSREGDAPDATFVNTRLGSLLIYKTDQTQSAVEGAEFSVEGKEGTFTSDANGLFCVDGLVVGDTVTVTETKAPDGWEAADPNWQDVLVTQGGACEDHDATPDATFTNNLLGSLLVLKVDEGDPVAPLSGAEFTITGPDAYEESATSDADGWFCLDGLTYGAEYTVTETKAPEGYLIGANNPQMHTIDDSMTCAERIAAESGPVADLVFSNAREAEDRGSITVIKEVDCDECETRTIGYYFNAADQHEDETNALFDGLGGIMADGILFTNVDQVQQYRADDQDGTSDGQNGLSARGQLTLQYLGAALNVARNGEDCDLASRVYDNDESPFDGWTVGSILAEADKAFDGTSEYSDEEIKSALDDINNSSHEEENPLSCEGTESGTLDGVTFDLFLEADYPDGEPIATGMTGDDGPGTVVFGDLALDETYVLVESGFPEGVTCEIVDVIGEGFEFTLNEDGSVTIVLTANAADVTLTVVNECDEDQEEEEFGEVEIIKDANDPTESFSFSATWDADGFTLVDGGLEPSGLLEAGSSVTVTEELTAEQMLAGWSLEDIDCGDADVTVDGSSVTITVVADTTITCEFTNVLEEQPDDGVLEIDKVFCITSGEADTEFLVFDPTVPEEFGTFGLEEEQPDEGCWTEDVAFTITGGDLTEPVHVMTGDDGIIEVVLPESENAYLLTEDLSGESAEFRIEDGAITVVLVVNWIPEEAENGTLKVIKLFCETDDAAEAGVAFQVEGENVSVPVLQGCTVGDATFELGDDEFSVGADGLAILTVEVGEYDFAEIAPNAAVYAGTVPVVEGEYTTVIVYNTFVEDEQGGGGGGGGVTPGQSQTPREGTAGGNPLPNTATTPAPGGSLPAILLALTALGALAVGGQRMAAEARRRR